MPVKLVEIIRSGIVESEHRGDIAIIDSNGRLLYRQGNTSRLTLYRSAQKPFQAITALESGIAEKFGLDLKEIALTFSSHSGEDIHIETIKSILAKTKLTEGEMECGIHEPLDVEKARELRAAGKKPTRLHNNCSAKHLALMAACKLYGLSVCGYINPEHGIQRKIDEVIAAFCRISPANLKTAVDGCGLPNHGVPLRNMALSYANLCNLDFLDGKYAASQNYIISAATMYPEMVAGTRRLDTVLMKMCGDRIISKIGAEGVICVGLLKKGIGIAIKIEDGNSRAVAPVIIEVLRQLKIISDQEIQSIKEYSHPIIKNNRGEEVGEIKAVFTL